MNKRWRRLVVGMAALAVVFVPVWVMAARGTQTAPKLLNLYLDWQIPDNDLKSLSNWDIVVLDMDMQWQAPDRIRAIREANPKIKILAYVSAGELAVARASGDHASPGYQLSALAEEGMYMHHADGRRLAWWPGANLMNATDRGPLVNGERWNTAMPDFVRTEMMSTGLWDGVFLDGAYDDIGSFFGKDVDMNGDGRAEDPATVNAVWRAGMTKLIRNMRAAVGPNGLLLNNSSTAYAGQVNGVLFENFPRNGWTNTFRAYQQSLQQGRRPTISALNANTNNVDRPDDYQLMRFGLTSALLGDGYFSFDAGDSGHSRTWWYDEYDASLGTPTGEAHIMAGTKDVWIRAFQRGIVVVNTGAASRTVDLPGVFEKLHGRQDAATNSGALVRSLTIAAQDGMILLGRSDVASITNGAFVNGSFVRAYRMDGSQVRNGFVAERGDVPSGATVIASNLDGRGTWTVSAQNGAVTATPPDGRVRSFRPFGSSYRGGLSIAVGDVVGNATQEIIVGRNKAMPSDVRVFSTEGKQLHAWVAYNPSFAGGARVGVGDLDGDGKREIVTGAGPGGGSHVRIFSGTGGSAGGSFFAFNATERGGVTIAVGDLDGDGKSEIIVGSGEGAIPRVRVFDFRGTLKTELTFGSQPVLSGLTVTTSDLDGDGLAEMLVSGLSAF